MNLLSKKYFTDEHKINLYNNLYRSIFFTSKYLGLDELTNEKYDENELRVYKIKGIQCVNEHNCCGDICYNPKNSEMLKWVDLMFWNEYGVLYKHNLLGNINVMRSNNVLDMGVIDENECIRFSKSQQKFVIRVKLENRTKEKNVDLDNLQKYNPNLELKIKIPDKKIYEDAPYWLMEIYNIYIELLNKITFNSQPIKKEIYNPYLV